MEWPWEHPRRGKMPPTYSALSMNEYSVREPPYTKGTPFEKVFSYLQNNGSSDYSKNLLVDEKDHPFTGTRYAWVRARVLGGKTNLWGRLALRLSDYDFKAKSRDGYGEDWPISYADVGPYYDRVDRLLGISGHAEGLDHLPDGVFQRPLKLNAAEIHLRRKLGEQGRVLTPYRAGVTTDGVKNNKYRSRCWGRGACSRRVGGCDIHASFDSPTGLIYPGHGDRAADPAHRRHRARDPGGQQHRPGPRGRLHRQPDPQELRGPGPGGGGGGFHPGVRPPAAAVEVAPAPQRHRQLQRTRRAQLLRAPHGPGGERPAEGSGRQAPHQRRREAGRVLPRALPQPRGQAEQERQAARLHPGLRVRGGQRGRDGQRRRDGDAPARFRQALEEEGARRGRRHHRHGRFWRGACRASRTTWIWIPR